MNLEPRKNVATPAAPKEAEDKEPTKNQPEKAPPIAWAAVGAALTVVVAILGVMGLEEDLLRRMVRNYPRATAIGLTLVVLGAAIPLALLLLRTPKLRTRKVVRGTSVACAAIATIGLVVVVWTGAESLNSRDMPSVSLSATKDASGAVTIKSEATAVALRSREKMLLRLYAYSNSESQNMPRDCHNGNGLPSLRDPGAGGRVLQWGEAGPDKAGSAKVAETLAIKGDDYSLVCAYAVLQNVEQDDRPYYAWSTVDLRGLTIPAEPASSPRPTPSAP